MNCFSSLWRTTCRETLSTKAAAAKSTSPSMPHVPDTSLISCNRTWGLDTPKGMNCEHQRRAAAAVLKGSYSLFRISQRTYFESYIDRESGAQLSQTSMQILEYRYWSSCKTKTLGLMHYPKESRWIPWRKINWSGLTESYVECHLVEWTVGMKIDKFQFPLEPRNTVDDWK